VRKIAFLQMLRRLLCVLQGPLSIALSAPCCPSGSFVTDIAILRKKELEIR